VNLLAKKNKGSNKGSNTQNKAGYTNCASSSADSCTAQTQPTDTQNKQGQSKKSKSTGMQG
jgi:hypothetical protein